MHAIDRWRDQLAAVPVSERDEFLVAHSGLPGPRGNLELAQAAADLGDERSFRRGLAGPDEYLACCGAIGLGRLIVEGRADLWPALRAAAGDARWRVREGVAMGLQRVGDHDMGVLLHQLASWVDGSPLERRAVVAGLCEPRLLRGAAVVRRAVKLVDQVTRSLLAEPDRRDPDVRVLRQALGYGWSVLAAADPAVAGAAFLKMEAVGDADLAWIARENRKKKRMPALAQRG